MPRIIVSIPFVLQFAIPGVLRISAALPTEVMVPREVYNTKDGLDRTLRLVYGQQTPHSLVRLFIMLHFVGGDSRC